MLATVLPFCTTASHPYTMQSAQSTLEKNTQKAKQHKQKDMTAVLICFCMSPAFASGQAMQMCAWHKQYNNCTVRHDGTCKGMRSQLWHMGRRSLLKRCIHMSTDI